MSLITRVSKGSSLSYAEMDGNLEYLEERINQLGTGGGIGTSGAPGSSGSSGTSGISGTSGTSGVGTSGTSGTSASLSSYVGDASIDGDLVLTGTLNDVPISRGGGNSGENLAIGYQALESNAWTSGDAGNFNTAIGSTTLSSNEIGLGNTAVGSGAMTYCTGGENAGFGFQTLFFDSLGNYNTAIGSRALNYLGNGQPVSQEGNTAIGTNAGRWVTPGSSIVNQSINSIFIGYNARPKANAQTNQIVIGTNTPGNGSNTATIGNSTTDALYLGGKAGEGIVLTSPNGTKYRITVSNAGVLTVTAAV